MTEPANTPAPQSNHFTTCNADGCDRQIEQRRRWPYRKYCDDCRPKQQILNVKRWRILNFNAAHVHPKATPQINAQYLRIIESAPRGLTTAQVANRLGNTIAQTSTRLSKLASYGIVTRVRIPRTVGGGRLYLWLPAKKNGATAGPAPSSSAD